MGANSFFGILPRMLPYETGAVPIEALALPKRVTLLWKHGVPGDLVVHAGHLVQTGQNMVRARLRPFVSTVTGTVEEITAQRGPDGNDWVAVTIGDVLPDQYAPRTPIEDVTVLSPGRVLTALTLAGIPGLCPVAPRPDQPQEPGAIIDSVVVSALDSDLETVVNPQVLREHADEIEAGIQILGHATGVRGVVLAVPEDLAAEARGIPGAEAWVVPVRPVYPNGAPEMLARRLGGGWMLRLDGRRVVGNTLLVTLERLVAMDACLRAGRPWVEKIVTCVTGGDQRRNLRARIGTPITDILKHLELEVTPQSKLILGGLMRGDACYSLDQPITAWTDGLIVQPPEGVFRYEPSPCTNCGECNAVCPVDLQVNLLGRFAEYGLYEKCAALVVDNCIECGLCAYVCPARRPLVQYFRHAKSVLLKEREGEVVQS